MKTVGITGVIFSIEISYPNKPDDMPLASHVRKSVTAFLFFEYDKGR